MANSEQVREKLQKDAEYFKEMLERMDNEGRFDNRFPNFGEKYDLDEMVSDALAFDRFVENPDNMSFWR
jgi:hypothetical protein